MNKEYLEAKAEDISKLLYEVYDVPSSICEYIDESLQRIKDLEEQIGCPLEVRIKVVPNTYIYTFGTSMETLNIITERKVITINEDGIYISYATVSGKERDMVLSWKAYKKTWWLREDKSE